MIAAARPPLCLLAPWFRWEAQRPAVSAPAAAAWSPRDTRPVLLKFDAPDMVNRFLKDPQGSFRFHADFDEVRVPTPPGPTQGVTDFGAIVGIGKRYTLLPTGVRKLYRDVHKRGYLVVCEMHCDAAGLPDPAWDRACEMGFVIRRRRPVDPEAYRRRVSEVTHTIGDLRRRIRALDAPPLLPPPVQDLLGLFTTKPATTTAQILAIGGKGKEIARAQYWLSLVVHEAARRSLERLEGVEWQLERWVADPELEKAGRWEAIARAEAGEEPPALAEKVYPLYPVAADPRDATHSALGARLLFGKVPTGDLDLTPDGAPHLDAEHQYEIRCFVREHRPGCRRRATPGDCSGRLVWSEPTEPYRIASQTDPLGAANQQITVELPDIPALAAHPGMGGSVRMNAPELSSLNVVPGFPPGGSLGGPLLCTWSIPLITIIALFVLNIFKPIVVNIFRLHHLLLEKVCFPAGPPPLPGAPPALAFPPGFEPKAFGAFQPPAGMTPEGMLARLRELGDAAKAVVVSNLEGIFPTVPMPPPPPSIPPVPPPSPASLAQQLADLRTPEEMVDLLEEMFRTAGRGPSHPAYAERLVPEVRLTARPTADELRLALVTA